MSELEKMLLLQGKKFLFAVETSADSADYAKYEELRNEIWGFPEDNLPGTRNMMCENFLHEGSSLFIAVYGEDASGRIRKDRESLVGFSYGFVGVRDKAVTFHSLDNLWFYSQYTGVKPGYQGTGLGIRIKEFQRELLVERLGIFTITCTYDPLTGINAYRNVHRFGMEVLEYRAATYGEYGGFLNRTDVPSDRFFMSWDLRKPVKRPAYRFEDLLSGASRIIRAEYSLLSGKTRPVKLEVIKELNLERPARVLALRIPRDFYLMLAETDQADPEIRRIPVDWRVKTRTAFQSLFAEGYKIIDFRKLGGPEPKNFYILKRSS